MAKSRIVAVHFDAKPLPVLSAAKQVDPTDNPNGNLI
jgi:hypothetical protein